MIDINEILNIIMPFISALCLLWLVFSDDAETAIKKKKENDNKTELKQMVYDTATKKANEWRNDSIE